MITLDKNKQLLDDLKRFSGTENYYKSSFGRLLLTDGIQFLRESANCFWLIDIVESVQHLEKIKQNNSFIVWKIEVNDDRRFKVSAWIDTPYKSEMLYEQKGDLTDFPLSDFEFYQQGNVLLLKNEN